jgi:acyl-CoA synthetase (AMP-forming)/AMP-acid ligase II
MKTQKANWMNNENHNRFLYISMQDFIDRLKTTCERCQDKKAIQVVDGNCNISMTITFAQLWNQTGQLAAHFLKEGIRSGERVMIFYPNTAQSVLVDIMIMLQNVV